MHATVRMFQTGLIGFLALLLLSGFPLPAAESPNPPPAATVLAEKTVETPFLQALDEAPLAGRMPLVLIHGIDPGRGIYDNWDLYVNAFREHPAFLKRYKLYRYHYDPLLGVDENAALLTLMLERFIADNDVAHMRILAHSMGGVLVRNLSEGHLLRDHVDRVLTIGTPFHGTPLTVKPWIMKQTFLLSPLRGIYRLAYRITGKRHPTFMQDYCWDNFDASMPEKVTEKHNGNGHCRVWKPNPNTQWIVYGSFFTDNRHAQSWLAESLEAPETMIDALQSCEVRKAGWFGARRRLVFAREKFKKLDLRKGYLQKTEDKKTYSLMSFSDGVSPISSQLWLGRFVDHTGSAETENGVLLSALMSCSLQSDGITRLFPGLDHRDWMSGETRYKYGDKAYGNRIYDLLHPDQASKTAIEWVVQDLLSE